MPRKTGSAKRGKTNPSLPEPEPQPTLTSERGDSPDAPSGRARNGQFTKGNSFGPGNPHARHCARMLDLFRTCISDEDMVHLYRVLFDKAMTGDVSAAKLVLAYKIGKPAPAPNPDRVDRDEWEHYQNNTINLEQMQQVLSSLPAKVGNDIARTALPIMTEARTRELETQLRKECPILQEVDESPEDADGQSQKAPPLSNGDSSGQPQKARPLSNGNSSCTKGRRQSTITTDDRSSTNDQRPSIIDHRSSTNDDRSSTNDQPSTINQRSTTKDQRFSRHAARNSPPLSNGQSA